MIKKGILLPLLLAVCVLSGCAELERPALSFSLEEIPAYAGEPYVVIDDNIPAFPQEDYTTNSFEEYSPLDLLGRCGVAYANVSVDTMPTEDRGAIGQIKPSGWHTVKYESVDGKYLYNRCHLIGFQLTAENANEENLITGTRYLNVDGMLPFENLVADYIQETEHHVLYRVTPVFEGTELVARGVQMEAWSVESDGSGVCFNVFVYNNQPGITIDYQTGESWLQGEAEVAANQDTETATPAETTYVLNTKSGKFHYEDCSGAASISDANRGGYTGSREALIEQGYSPCGQCKP